MKRHKEQEGISSLHLPFYLLCTRDVPEDLGDEVQGVHPDVCVVLLPHGPDLHQGDHEYRQDIYLTPYSRVPCLGC